MIRRYPHPLISNINHQLSLLLYLRSPDLNHTSTRHSLNGIDNHIMDDLMTFDRTTVSQGQLFS